MEEAVVEAGTQEETPQVHTMSREQLESLRTSDTPEPEVKEEIEPNDNVDIKPETETRKAAKEPEPEKEPAPETAEKEPSVEELKSELNRLRKKAENQDKFFARQATEIGLLRKKTPAEKQAELERIRDLYITDPEEGHRAHEEYIEREREMERAVNEQAQMDYARKNYDTIQSIAPDIDTHFDDIFGIMRSDGANEDIVASFKNMPYAMPLDTMFNLYKRSILTKENESLKSKVAEQNELIKELKSKPNSVLENIEKAANNKPITAKSAGAASKKHDTQSTKPFHMMSLEELKAFQEAGG